mgnify:FL=1
MYRYDSVFVLSAYIMNSGLERETFLIPFQSIFDIENVYNVPAVF